MPVLFNICISDKQRLKLIAALQALPPEPMSIDQTSLEFSLAAKKISQLKDQHYGRFVCIRAAIKLLVSQGFSRDHSAKVSEAAFELIFTE